MAGVANRGVPGAGANPLAGVPWGVYKGQYYNSIYPNYQAARGSSRELLGRIALRPLAFWFGSWFADGDARQVAHNFIASTTGGKPNVLSQMVVFRLDPWEGGACPGGWSAADQRSYRRWIDGFAAGIGQARVAIVLQPDLAFSTCASSHAPLELVSYAARKLNAQPHTTVYVDGGVHYWPSFGQAVSMLEQAAVRHARDPADDPRRQLALAPLRPRREPRVPLRRRVHVDRPPVASRRHAVRPSAGAAAGRNLAVRVIRAACEKVVARCACRPNGSPKSGR
ncbi:MAG TPA: glycoside hydrolase family 6 protein [Solirubrobacteraceae bacterium]